MTKTIHYCWFGGKPLSKLTLNCIESWKKYLPDFEIKEWNETNFDVNECIFIKEAYEQKKWAFVADYTRFKVLDEFGGMYLDTDMEITSDVSKYLKNDLFFGVEDSRMVNAAVIWSKYPNNTHIHSILQIYQNSKVFNPTGDLFDQSVPKILTKYFMEYGFKDDLDKIQFLNNDVYIYPMEYFYPLSYDHQSNKFTDKSCMIHHFDATWTSKGEQLKTKLKRKNMSWMIYVIDFLVSIKNEFKTMLNYRDLLIFLISICLFFIYHLVLLPGENNILSILQIASFSFVWTFICESIRTVELNQLLDKKKKNKKNTLFDIKRNKPLKGEYDFIFKIEKNIFIKQLIVTVIFILTPIIGILTGILSFSEMLYSACTLFIIYMMYIGIIKKFKYRILELIFIAFLLMLNQIYYTNNLIFSGVLIIILISLMLLNRLNKKRFIAFLICLVFFGISLFGLKSLLNINSNKKESISNYKNLYNFESIQVLDNYNKKYEGEKATSFVTELANINYSDNILKKAMYNPTVIFYITIVAIIILAFLKRNSKYLLLILPILLQFFNNTSLSILLYMCYISFYFIIQLLVVKSNIKD